MAIDKRISYAFGGTGGKTGGKGGQNGSADRGGKAHKAAAEKAQKAARDARESNARENAIRTAALTTKTKAPTRSPHKDTPTQKKEQLAIDLSDFESEDKKVKAPKTLTPRTKIIDQGVPHLEDPITKTVPHYYGGIGSKTTTGFGPKGTQTYSQAVEDSMKRGFFDSGIGKVIKTALPFAIPALLPTKLATPYRFAKLGLDIKNKKGIVGQAINQALTSNLASNISTSNLTGKRSTTDTTTDTRDDRFRGDKGEGKQAITAPKKDVVTESIEKFTPRQMDLVRQRYNQLRQVMESGMFGNRRLTADELAKLGGISKQMEAFLVDPQKMMMMARGGLAGLNG